MPATEMLDSYISKLNHKATDEEVDGDNNLAERVIRKAVIIRKISNGNRSKNGAKFLEILLSVIETLKLQGINY